MPAPNLSPSVILMSFISGNGPDAEANDLLREVGRNANWLIAEDINFERHSGQPRMSEVLTSVARQRPGAPIPGRTNDAR
jgi:hypothetical protein